MQSRNRMIGIAVFLLVFSMPAFSLELIANGGFENANYTDAANWTKIWDYAEYSSLPPNITYTDNATYVLEGSRSLILNNTVEAGSPLTRQVRQTVNISGQNLSGQIATFSIIIDKSYGGVQQSANAYIHAKNDTDVITENIAGIVRHYEYDSGYPSVTFIIPAGTTLLEVNLYTGIPSSRSGFMIFDNVSLTVAAESPWQIFSFPQNFEDSIDFAVFNETGDSTYYLVGSDLYITAPWEYYSTVPTTLFTDFGSYYLKYNNQYYTKALRDTGVYYKVFHRAKAGQAGCYYWNSHVTTWNNLPIPTADYGMYWHASEQYWSTAGDLYLFDPLGFFCLNANNITWKLEFWDYAAGGVHIFDRYITVPVGYARFADGSYNYSDEIDCLANLSACKSLQVTPTAVNDTAPPSAAEQAGLDDPFSSEAGGYGAMAAAFTSPAFIAFIALIAMGVMGAYWGGELVGAFGFMGGVFFFLWFGLFPLWLGILLIIANGFAVVYLIRDIFT